MTKQTFSLNLPDTFKVGESLSNVQIETGLFPPQTYPVRWIEEDTLTIGGPIGEVYRYTIVDRSPGSKDMAIFFCTGPLDKE